VLNKDYAGAGQCTIFIYVNDLYFTCQSKAIIDKVLDVIQRNRREVKTFHGTSHNYLGMTLKFLKDLVHIGMESAIDVTFRSEKVEGSDTSVSGNNLVNIPLVIFRPEFRQIIEFVLTTLECLKCLVVNSGLIVFCCLTQ